MDLTVCQKLLLIFQFKHKKLDDRRTETCITLSTKQTVNLIKHSQQKHQQTHQLVRKHFLFPSLADVLAGFRTNEVRGTRTDERNMQTVNKNTDCRSAPVTYIHTI